MKELPENIIDSLKTLVDQFRLEDKAVRERQLRAWKRLSFMWEGFQHVWWNEVAHDWRIFDLQNTDVANSTGYESYYDKQANIFKALLESIIAALSVSIPGLIGVPDDADNLLDLQTAKAAAKIAELVGKHNDEKLFWLHGLFTFMTQGQTFAYSYTDESFNYGSYAEPKFENDEITIQNQICPICKTNIASVQMSDKERDEYNPGQDDVLSHDYLNAGQNLCPQCLVAVDPELQEDKMIVPRLVGYVNKPKARQCLEVYGGLYVKVPNYAFKQCDIPYLCLSKEMHYSFLVKKFAKDDPDLADKIRNNKGGASYANSYDRWARLNPQYMGEYPTDTPTWNQWWLRPESFYSLAEERDCKDLLKKFPDGVKIDYINDDFCCAVNESLDDHWTSLKNPMSNYIHFEPTGEGIVPMQEVTNEMISLIIQTIEHGIGQTFASPNILNFEQYRQTEATPGQIFPTIPQSGKNIADSFYQLKTATLSAEVMPFVQYVQDMAQMVCGALPSLWGGAQPNSSKTLGQYSESRAQALQRLQNTWVMFLTWWKEIYGKVIPAFIENMVEDEKYVDQDEHGNFLNVFIRKSELQGKIGSIELDCSDQLPTTWAQKADKITTLLMSTNPMVQQAIVAPENFELIKDTIGLNEFTMPGEVQREYQLEEINGLISSAPIMGPPQPNPMTGQITPGQPTPSIAINPFDDNQVHSEICKNWLSSDAGRLCKTENQQGYANVLLHWQAHNAAVQQQQMQAFQMQEAINQSKVSAPKAGASASGNNPPNAQAEPLISPQPQNQPSM